MTEQPRQIAVVRSYDEFLALCRQQVGALGITYAILDDVTCFTDSYATKLLAQSAPSPGKRGAKRNFSRDSFDAYLSALCFDLVAVENPEKVAKLRVWLERKLEGRKGPIIVRSPKAKPLSMEVVANMKSELFRELGRRGGIARLAIPRARRREIAQQAARARWQKADA